MFFNRGGGNIEGKEQMRGKGNKKRAGSTSISGLRLCKGWKGISKHEEI